MEKKLEGKERKKEGKRNAILKIIIIIKKQKSLKR